MTSLGETRTGAEGAGKNSQAKGPATDRTLEKTPYGVTEGAVNRPNLSGKRTEAVRTFYSSGCLFFSVHLFAE